MKKFDKLLIPLSIILAAIIISFGLSNINYAENKCFKENFKARYEIEIKEFSSSKSSANSSASIIARQNCK